MNRMRKNKLFPRQVSDIGAFLFVVIMMPATYIYETAIVVPAIYSSGIFSRVRFNFQGCQFFVKILYRLSVGPIFEYTISCFSSLRILRSQRSRSFLSRQLNRKLFGVVVNRHQHQIHRITVCHKGKKPYITMEMKCNILKSIMNNYIYYQIISLSELEMEFLCCL